MRLVAIVVAIAALLGAASLAAPGEGGAPAASSATTVSPTRHPVACPGPLEIPVGSIVSGDEELDSGSTDVTYDVRPDGSVLGAGTAVDEPQAVSLERVGTGDISGLAGYGCTPPKQEQWLLGGSTALGSSARLVLSNPTESPVRVRLDVHGTGGAVVTDLSVLVGAGAQESLLLESVAPDQPAVAVRVVAEGVGISATLQDSRLDGFTPAGTDWVDPVRPGDTVVIPYAGPVTAAAPGTLTLVAPDGAQATVELLTEDGPVAWLGDEVLDLDAGVVTEVRLPETEIAAVRVAADSAVAAAVRVTVAREAAIDAEQFALDHAWTGGQAATGARAAVVPEGRVALVVAGAAGFTAEAGGATLDVDVAQDSVAVTVLDLEPGTVVSSDSTAAWTLRVEDQDAGFVTTVDPVGTELPSREVTVSVGDYAPASP